MDNNTGAIIKVKVVPRSSKNEIIGVEDGVIKIKLTAPPVEGKANKALKGLIAKKLGLSKGEIEIISGDRSRLKSIRIRGFSPKRPKVDILEEFCSG